MIEDKKGNTLEIGKWYEIVVEDTNPYEFVRFVFIVKAKENKSIVLELWRNSNTPNLAPAFSVLSNVFFQHHMAIPADETKQKDKIEKAFEKYKNAFIKKLFEDSFVKRGLSKL